MKNFILFFIVITSTTLGFELTCRYDTNTDWWAINNIYFCDLMNDLDFSKSNATITAVNGDELNGNSNADVIGFRAFNKKLLFFPQDLKKFFDVEKFQFIAIWSTGLKEIHQNDLSPFTNMTILSLWNNDFEIIERDLLKFNPQIEYIGLGKNKIKFIDGNVFSHLKNLHTLHIDGNPCISRQVAGDRHKVLDILKEIEEKCGFGNDIESVSTSTTLGFELKCRYDTNTDWWAINNIYFCDLMNDLDFSNSNATITAVNGEEMDGKSNADVIGFRAFNKTLLFFPQDLKKFFDVEKFHFIAIWSTGLKEIHQNDLSPFTNMRILSLWNNDFEIIERDLLKFNPQIEYIGLGKNKIKFIDGNVFGHLENLHTMHIDGNPCISRQVAGDRHKVLDLLKEIEEKCGFGNDIEPVITSTTLGFELTCRYDTNTDWWAINNIYYCDLMNDLDISKSNTKITAVNGDELDGKSNADVIGFRAFNKKLLFFPQDLQKFFDVEKFQFIAIWSTGLKEIHQNDLSPFTNMRILSLWNNDFEIIEHDLLKFNPQIESIGLGKNKIKFIDGNVFGHLENLHTMHIDGNPCISKQVAGDRHKVLDLLKEIEEKCGFGNDIEPVIPSTTLGFELKCRYDTNTDWWAINNIYYCDLMNDLDISKSNTKITTVNGDELDGKSNADVIGFRAFNKKLLFFPQDLQKFFDVEKFQFIAIWSTGLKEIHQNDLSPFTNMRILSLWNNDFEIIEHDLLKFNPQIESIGLGKNKIKFIDGNVFGHLENLHTMQIDENPCISKQVAGDRHKVLDLLKEIEEKCGFANDTEHGVTEAYFEYDVRSGFVRQIE